MAPGGSCPCCFPHRNPLPINPVEDELARDPSSIGGSHSGNTTPAPSCNPISDLDLILALISAPVLATILAPVPTDKLFKKFMEAYLELNQGPRHSPAERKQTLKAKCKIVNLIR